MRTSDASASALGADQLQVLGGKRVRQLQRPRGRRAPDQRTGRRLDRREPARRGVRAPRRPASRTAPEQEIAATRLARAVLGLGQQVQRHQTAGRHRRPSTTSSRWARRSRRSRRCPTAGAWPPARTGCRGPRSRPRAPPSRSRRRAPRSPARRPCGRPAPPRTAGTRRGSSESICPSAPGGEHTTTSSTPAARAVTTPITTVLG